MMARGPGIKPGTRLTSIAANIDIAPTFLDIIGLSPNPQHDGKSMYGSTRFDMIVCVVYVF